MTDDIRWEWLDRYFSGDCTPDEEREIDRWIAEAPERQSQVDALREIWARAASQRPGRWDAEAAWRRLAPTLDAAASAPRPRLTVVAGGAGEAARPPRRRVAYATAMRAAAAIAIVAAGIGLWRLDRAPRTIATAAPAPLREYATPNGQRATITLADGTRIMLAPGTTMRAPTTFAADARRDVYLEGEALFEVTHDERRPFVVHAAHGVAEDLGTRFVVTAYPGDTATRVVVAEGVVALRGAADSLAAPSAPAPRILRAGDLGVVSRTGQLSGTHAVALDEYLGWTTGQLVFRSARVGDVVAVLARWYDVTITIDDPKLRQRTFTGTFDEEPVTKVLESVAGAVGATVGRTGQSYLLRGK